MKYAKKNTFVEAAERIRPTSFLDYRSFLRLYYSFVKARTPGYTYERFAADLGYAETNLFNQIVNGSRKMMPRIAQDIAPHLGLKHEQRRYFINLVTFASSRRNEIREKALQSLFAIKQELAPSDLEKTHQEFFSSWHHIMLRELVACRPIGKDPEQIVDQLTLSLRPEQIRSSLEVLERLGMIYFDSEKNRYIQTEPEFSTGHETHGMSIIKYHQDMLDLTKKALVDISERERDVSALSLGLDESGLRQLKILIHEFQAKALELSNLCQNPTDVYQLNLQLFPFTKNLRRGTL